MMQYLTRVSNVESFRRWKAGTDERLYGREETLEDLIRYITTDEPSPAMQAGIAFHKAMETIEPGTEAAILEVDGYVFTMPDAEISVPEIREMRGTKDYGSLSVTGQADCIHGRVIQDYKTTGRVDFERYLDGCQWRFYLDIFNADVFRWNVFEIREIEPKAYIVKPPQTLTVYRYPGLHDDCCRLAEDFLWLARHPLMAGQSEKIASDLLVMGELQ